MLRVEHCTSPSLATIMMLRIQGRLVGRLARRISQLRADAAGGADIGRRFQHRLDRGDHLALGIGAVLGDVGEFFGGRGDLLGAGVLERTDAFQHQGRHQDQRQQRQPRADSQKLLEFRPVAVESNARHLRSPAPCDR